MTLRPLRIGDESDFRIARRGLREAGFTHERLLERLALRSIDAVESAAFRVKARHVSAGPDSLGALADLFVLGRFLPVGADPSPLLPDLQSALLALDLLRRDSDDRLWSPVRLVPVPAPRFGEDLLIACDRTDHPDGAEFKSFPEIVFSAHNPLTLQFLRSLPEVPGDQVLELCSGTGAAALAMSRRASQVAAVDINDRCLHFAEFNRRLNERPNVEMLRGDLYQPVGGGRFDCVVAHPPYVPTRSETAVYRDGGETGESVIRRIVQQLPRHLAPGGRFHILGMAFDTSGMGVEARARHWLGQEAGSFDVVFVQREVRSITDFARTLVEKVADSRPEDIQAWMKTFEALGATSVSYGLLAGRRFAETSGDGQTRRVQWADGGVSQGLASLFDWFDWLRRPDRAARVLALELRLAPETRLDVRHHVAAGALRPQTYRLANGGRPFPTAMDIDAWVAGLLQSLEGQPSVDALYRERRGSGLLPDGLGTQEFCDLVCILAERGFVNLRGDGAPVSDVHAEFP